MEVEKGTKLGEGKAGIRFGTIRLSGEQVLRSTGKTDTSEARGRGIERLAKWGGGRRNDPVDTSFLGRG